MHLLYSVVAALALAGAWLSTTPLASATNDEAKDKAPRVLSPKDYLKLLQKHFKDKPSYCPGLEGPSVRAVKEEEVTNLIKLFDSKEKCSATMAAGSSVYAAEGSTVGHEAAVLVDSLRTGKTYPIANTSTKHEVDRESLLKWWKEKQKQSK